MKGFTIFEVLITLALVSIISGVTALEFSPMWSKHQLRIATRDLSQRLQIERVRAILTQIPHQIEIQSTFFLSRQEGGKWQIEDLPSGISYFRSKVTTPCLLTTSPKAIRITYNGAGTSNGITLCLMKDRWYRKIILNSYGRIRTTPIQT